MPPDGVERHPAQQEAQEDHPWAISLSVCRVRVPGSSARLSTTRPSLGSLWPRGCASPRHGVRTRWPRVFPGTTATCRSNKRGACAGAPGAPRGPSCPCAPRAACPPCWRAPRRATQPAPGGRGGGRVTPWPLAVAALPCAGSGPGWPVAARRCGAPPCKTRTRGPATWGPMRRGPGERHRRALSRPLSAGAVSWGGAWSRRPRRDPWRGARARVPRTPRRSRQTPRRARCAPLAGQRHGRRGGDACPRATWCGAFSTRSCRGKSPGRARGATRASTRPGRSTRRRPPGSVRSACGAWPRGRRGPAAGRWPRGGCSGVAVGPTARRPMSVRRPTAPPLPSLGGATPKTGGSTPGALGTAPPTARAWPYGPWRCSGTCTRMVCACGGTSRREWLPVTTSTACSLTPTGCIPS